MSKYKTISVTPQTFTEFEQLCTQYGMNKGEALATMVNYFKASKADPRDPQPIDLKTLERRIAETDKRIIGFIKTQEKEILRPMQTEVELIAAELSKLDVLARLKVMNDNIIKIGERIR